MKKMDEESVKADMEESEYKEKCRTSKVTRSSAFARNLPRYAIQTIVANGQTSARHISLLSMGGQDYHSLDSVSTTVQPGYNWTASGTHGAFDKFFDGYSIDGGLASRVLFAEMPYSLFEPLAKEQQQSAQNIKRKITEAMSRDEEVWVSLRALCQYSTSQRKSPLAGIDSPESERVPLAMMPRKPSSVTL